MGWAFSRGEKVGWLVGWKFSEKGRGKSGGEKIRSSLQVLAGLPLVYSNVQTAFYNLNMNRANSGKTVRI